MTSEEKSKRMSSIRQSGWDKKSEKDKLAEGKRLEKDRAKRNVVV